MLWPKHLNKKYLELEKQGRLLEEQNKLGQKHLAESERDKKGYHLRYARWIWQKKSNAIQMQKNYTTRVIVTTTKKIQES